MSKFATVVIPFAFTPRWGQIVISSLKKFANKKDFDILVMNNSPEHAAIKAITGTSIGDGVKVYTPEKHRMRAHGGSLDCAIGLVDTPYIFTLESDCTVEKNGWLDWYAGHIQDEYTAMVGWYWNTAGRYYINASATLYRTELLKRLWNECIRNKDDVICYGPKLTKRMHHENTKTMIQNQEIGPFSDSRGFWNVDYPDPRPDQWWHEPGSWLYSRCFNQYQCVKIPGEVVYNPKGVQPEFQYNYYGPSKNEIYAKHHWAGTVSHNYDKHLITVQWEALASDWWINRELRMWEEWVPEDIRKDTIEKGLVRDPEQEKQYAKSRIHILEPGMMVKVWRGDAVPYIMGEPEPEIEDDGLLGHFAFWDENLMRVQFRETPKEPYEGQFMEGGIPQIKVLPKQCTKVKK